MAKMIQVRNVPDRVHRELVRRAKARNQTLTAFVEEILEREVAHPTKKEIFERIRSRTPLAPEISSAELIRAERREAGRAG
jgi:plasmid stability protein